MRAWPGGDDGQDQVKGQDQAEGQAQESTTLCQRAQDKLVQTLPVFSSVDINDLKARGLAPGLAAFHLALYVAVALYLVVSGTAKQLATKYLSLTAPDAAWRSASRFPLRSRAPTSLTSMAPGAPTRTLIATEPCTS